MAVECGIAEVYVLRKLHKEKMKKEEEERAKSLGIDAQVLRAKPRNRGRFFGMFKKIHPSSMVAGYDDAERKSANSSQRF
ncbi:hypothetical protein CDL15_Pgr006548 [Punica granatum]|uniref:Uncharacterized protein n=1 Tax=Punica granatum TaxID=22663 RepID=A0A218XYU4_PUNGR|nr:hypothetical protein CDL15_Pgr006548 [Punica granatum]PKI54891.1 hypothetical protein CRG98_024722 [Punica granatum]